MLAEAGLDEAGDLECVLARGAKRTKNSVVFGVREIFMRATLTNRRHV